MKFKVLFGLMLVLLMHGVASATTTSVQATSIVDPFNVPVSSAQLCFSPSNIVGNPTGFTVGGKQVLQVPVCRLVTAGVLASGTTVISSPVGVLYHIYLTAPNSTTTILKDYGYTPITGSIWSLDTYNPTNSVVTPVSTISYGTFTPLAPGTGGYCNITGVTPSYKLNCGIPVGTAGAQGPTGAQGPPVTFRGGFSTVTTYAAGDAVKYSDGSSYVSLQSSNLNHQPDTFPTYWAVLAQAGNTGPQGIQGDTGPQGPTGSTGSQGPAGAGFISGLASDGTNGIAVTGAVAASTVATTSVSASTVTATTVTAGTVTPAWLAKIGYVSSSTWGSGSTNINTFFNTTANCDVTATPARSCAAVADPGYANTDNPFLYASGVFAPGPSQAYFTDFRNGSRTDIGHNPGKSNFVGFNDLWTQVLVNDTTQGATGSTHNAGIDQWLWFSSPGLNGGNNGLPVSGWTINDAHVINMTAASPGITGAVDVAFYKTGVGDNHAFGTNNYSYGGQTDVSAEGNEGLRMATGTAGTQFLGTVSTGGTGATNITVACSQDCGNTNGGPGDGRYLIKKVAIVTGNVTALTNPSGNTPGTLTVDATVTPSTAWGTLSGNCGPASIPTPLGTGSTSVTCNVTMLSGTFAPGDLVCFSGTNHEQALLTAATSTTFTALLRKSHVGSTRIMANGTCGTFVDFTANDTTVGSTVLNFPFDIVGATDSHTLVYAWFGFSTSNNSPQLGNFFLQSIAASNMNNVGGIVTMTLSGVTPNNSSQLYAGVTLTITGASVSAYNGQCTGTFLVAGSASQIGCTQASSVGAGTSTGTVAMGTTGFGNSAFTLWPGAEVLDVNTYPTNKPGIVCPSSVCQFNVEPNNVNWSASAAVMEPQHYLWHGHQVVANQVIYNPSAKDSGGWLLLMQGAGLNASAAASGLTMLNGQVSTGVYAYHGGTLLPPGGIQLLQSGANTGLWNYFINATFAPDPIGAAAFSWGCPASGCTDLAYNYNIWSIQGNGVTSTVNYTPMFDELKIASKVSFVNPLPKTTYNDNILGATIATPAQPTVSTSNKGGNYADGTTRCYTTVTHNTSGATAQSPERCFTAGSTGTNTNSFTVVASRPQGASFYDFCAGATGAELKAKTTPGNNPDLVSWTDDGSITPSGACSTTNTTLPALDQWSFLQLNNGTANTKIVPGANVGQITLNLPAVTGTLALNTNFVASGASHAAGLVPDPGATAGTTKYLREDATWQTLSAASLSNGTTGSGAIVLASLLTPVRAGTWSIASGTTVAVTFSPAMSSTPSSCSVMASSDPTTAGAIWPTTLSTTGFTVNIHTAVTISGTYQCVLNNAN